MTQETQNQAIANGKNLPISWKDCTEIGRFIKGDKIEKAERKLEQVIEKDLYVPYTKYDGGAGHRSHGEQGGYPVKASEEILELIKSAKHNAEDQGMTENKLIIQNIKTNQGPQIRTPKRHRGQSKKSAHVKIIVGEQ